MWINIRSRVQLSERWSTSEGSFLVNFCGTNELKRQNWPHLNDFPVQLLPRMFIRIPSREKQPSEVFYKKGVVKNFAKFIGKHLYQSLFFNKLTGLRPASLFKKVFWHRCFPVNFEKFSLTSFSQNISGRLLLFRVPQFGNKKKQTCFFK